MRHYDWDDISHLMDQLNSELSIDFYQDGRSIVRAGKHGSFRWNEREQRWCMIDMGLGFK